MGDTCKLISRGKTTNCPKNTCREKKYCHIHEFAIRNLDRVYKICSVCQIGIRGTYGLCKKHVGGKARDNFYNTNKLLRAEFSRLRKININSD